MKKYVHIRRGWGAFVPCANEAKARKLAKHWETTGQGGKSPRDNEVIGMFIGPHKLPSLNTRTQLYPSPAPPLPIAPRDHVARFNP